MYPLLAALLTIALLAGCKTESSSRPPSPSVSDSSNAGPKVGPVFQEGIASRYADRLAGNPTASGTPYEPTAFTCAHRKLPLGTRVQVRRKRGGQTVVCTVNDRGPFHEKRIIDLSRAAAEALGFTGVAQVELRKVLD